MSQQDDFLATYGPYADEIAQRTGLDRHTVLGIMAHETGYGTKVNGKNNLFGITPAGKLADYPDIETGGKAFVDLINSKYPTVKDAKGPHAQAVALHLGGYNSVNPNYSSNVGAVIDRLTTPPGTRSYDPMSDYSSYGDPRSPGWFQKNITQVKAPNGATFSVHRDAAEAFKGLLADLDAAGYKVDPQTSGGFNIRPITGGTTLSPHSYGIAIDVNPGDNPYSKEGRLQTNLPPNVGQIARKWGLSWGGDWNDKKDPMHFEWTGRTMEAQNRPGTMTDATTADKTPTIDDLLKLRGLTSQPSTQTAPSQGTQGTSPPSSTSEPTPTIDDLLKLRGLSSATGSNTGGGAVAPPDRYHDDASTQPTDPKRRMGRNIAAGVVEGDRTVFNTLSNPSQLLLTPLMTLGAAGYDWLAPHVGLPRLTPEQRADLTGGDVDKGVPSNNSNLIVDTAGKLINKGLDAAGVPGQATTPEDVVPQTPEERIARKVATAATAAPALGASKVIGTVAAGTGAVAGDLAANNDAVPDYLKPAAELVGNVAGASGVAAGTAGGRAALTAGKTDSATAGVAARAKQMGIDIPTTSMGPSAGVSLLDWLRKYTPGSGAGRDLETAHTQFHNAVADAIGDKDAMSGNKRLPQTAVDQNKIVNDGYVDTLEHGAKANLDSHYTTKVADIEKNARTALSSQDADTVSKVIEATRNTPTKQKNAYDAWQKAGSPDGQAQNFWNKADNGTYAESMKSVRDALSNPGIPASVKFYLRQVQDELQSDMARSPDAKVAGANGKTVSQQYSDALERGKLLDILQSVPRNSDGSFSMTDFHKAVMKGVNEGHIGVGDKTYDLGEIAGHLPDTPSQTSKTITTLGKLADMAITAGGGHLLMGPLAIGGMPTAAALAGRLSGSYLRSDALRNRMIDAAYARRGMVPNPLLELGPQGGPLSGPPPAGTLPIVPGGIADFYRRQMRGSNPLYYLPGALTNEGQGDDIPTITVTAKRPQ